MRWARGLAVLALAALLTAVAVRAMTFVAPADHPIRVLAGSFDGHPDALLDRAMTEIGTAASRGGAVPPSARTAMAAVARKAPLAPEPFLVEGTIAEIGGDSGRAERLFLAARDHDPRSQGARYFLADRYLKTNRILPGLIEMSALGRLSEKLSAPLVPALAAYARTPGATTELRRFFERSPALRESTLAMLAGDPRNGPLILSLASPIRPEAPPAEWQRRLIQALITTGDYAGAEAMWRRVAGIRDRGLLYNPQFRALPALPPFNWSYVSGTAGVAEASGSGGLDVIYYGREATTFASQTLRLPPGRFRLSVRLVGASGETGLSWTIRCVPGDSMILQLPLDNVAAKVAAGGFTVPPAGCAAQLIELRARPGETARTAEVSISGLALERQAPGA
jgi:hypothetical protein